MIINDDFCAIILIMAIFIELFIVLALVIFGLWSLKNTSVISDSNQNANPTEYRTNNANNTQSVRVPAKYSDALRDFANARVQLDTNCQASPNAMTFKNGTYLMIDNRAPVSRIITVGAVYNVKPYDFIVVHLTSPILPVTWHIDCDQSQNVATILIQQ